MAIDKLLWDKAKLLFEHGTPLNEIAKQTGINKGNISKKSKADEWVKNDNKATLVNSEVFTILMQDEINEQKATLNKPELNLHNNQVLEKVNLERERELFNNDTVDNQSIVREAQKQVLQLIQDNPLSLLDNLPNVMALGKMTETNRKQLFGITEPLKLGITDKDNEIIVEIE